MKAYSIKEIGIGLWGVFKYETQISDAAFSKEIAEALCHSLNEAYRTGHDRGYDAGQSASERLRTLQ